MHEERLILHRTAIPEIKKFMYDMELDLDFTVLDLHSEMASKTHMDWETLKICTDEIHNSRRQSIGPYFVVSIGLVSIVLAKHVSSLCT